MTTIQVKPGRKTVHAPLHKFVHDFFNSSLTDVADREFVYTRPAVNILENEDAFELFVAAPGLSKDQFTIEVENDVLVIRAHQPEESEENKVNYKKREFDYAGFKRSFKLHRGLDGDRVSATYESGILKILIPKVEKQFRQIEIK